jgi:prephenate dehydrogenase
MDRLSFNGNQTKLIEFSIIGLGRFGSFWAKHLSRFYKTSFYDINEEKKTGVEQYGEWASLKENLAKDFIFLTIPIRRLAEFLKENRSRFRPGSVVIDCASVKMAVVDWFEQYLPGNVFYAASHPLFGPDSARNGLQGQSITLQPVRIPFQKYHLLVELFSEKMGLQVLNLPAEEHDRLMAWNLSLIHHLGRTFHAMQISKLPLMMYNLSHMNRIAGIAANDTEELFQDFYRFNPFAAQIRDRFLECFKMIDSKVAAYQLEFERLSSYSSQQP